MRILHAKTTQEKILLASSCACMNLVALISTTSISVYRVGNMTPIINVRLRDPLSSSATSATREHNTNTNTPKPLLLGTCVDWSPSGRILSVGFSAGWMMNVHVETGDIVRVFYPRESETTNGGAGSSSSQASLHMWPPMLLHESEGGIGIADGVKRSWSMSSTILAARWQSGGAKPISLEPTTCLALPMLRTSAPSIGELLRCDDVPVLFAVDSTLRVSIVLGGLHEVYSVQICDVPSHIQTACESFAPLVMNSSSGSSPQTIVRASSSPLRSFSIMTSPASSPLGQSRVDALFVIRTAPNTERLFSAALELPAWCRSVTNDRVFITAVLDEYTTLGLRSFSSCVLQWTSCVHKVYHAISATTSPPFLTNQGQTTSATAAPSAVASLLRDVLVAPLASPSIDEVEELFAKLTTVSLFQALEQLHETVASVVSRLQCETIICLEAALDVAGKVLLTSGGRRQLHDFLGSTLLAARDVVLFIQREGGHLDLVLCWVLQHLLKRNAAVSAQQQQPGATVAPPATHRWYRPPRSEDQPVIARTLHRMACGTATCSSSLDCSLDDLLELPRVYTQFTSAAFRSKGSSSSHCGSATLFDLGAKQVSHPSGLAFNATPRCSLISLVMGAETTSAVPVSSTYKNTQAELTELDDDDNDDLGEPITIEGKSERGLEKNVVTDDDNDGAPPAVRVFHIKETAGGSSPPQVASYAVISGSATRLESGPAPISMDALTPSRATTAAADNSKNTDATSSELLLLAHAEMSDKHVLLFSRGSQGGVTLGVFEQSGECSTFEATVEDGGDEGGDGEDGTRTTQCILEIDGIMPQAIATSSATTPPSLLGLSVSSSRGFGVLHTLDRFMIVEFDC